MQWWFYNTKKAAFRKTWNNSASQKSCQWHQWSNANVNLLQLKEDSNPVCEKQTNSDFFVHLKIGFCAQLFLCAQPSPSAPQA